LRASETSWSSSAIKMSLAMVTSLKTEQMLGGNIPDVKLSWNIVFQNIATPLIAASWGGLEGRTGVCHWLASNDPLAKPRGKGSKKCRS